MILLSTLPKNSLGIIKVLDVAIPIKTELMSLGLDVGIRVRIKNIKDQNIVVDMYSQGNKKRINIPLNVALKIFVLPV